MSATCQWRPPPNNNIQRTGLGAAADAERLTHGRASSLTNDRAEDGTTGRQVVYGHRMRSEAGFFHMGSGPGTRAHNLTGRSSSWWQFVNAHSGVRQVEAVILERYRCPARARLREMQLVSIHQPSTNRFGRSSTPNAILDGHPKGSRSRCECGAPDCYGAEFTARGS